MIGEGQEVAADRPLSSVENAMGGVEKSQAHLYNLVIDLAVKMKPILRQEWSPDIAKAAAETETDRERLGNSPHVRALEGATNKSMSTAHVVEFLLNNLEV